MPVSRSNFPGEGVTSLRDSIRNTVRRESLSLIKRKRLIMKGPSFDSDESTIIMGSQEQDDHEDDEDEEKMSIKSRSSSLKANLISPEVKVQSLLEKAKFYTSLCMGTTAILAVFAFLFLLPFVVEPAISTILADFSPEPVACVTTDHVFAIGQKNCSWASCREGCTSAAVRCHQIRVNYTKSTYDQITAKPQKSVKWDVSGTKFYVNTEGCGYPPRVNCTEFAKKFAYANTGKIFPCYYSRTYPETVVARYSWDDTLRYLILAITVPIVLFVGSVGILCFWYCLPKKKALSKAGSLIDNYDRKENTIDGEDEEEFEDEDEEEY